MVYPRIYFQLAVTLALCLQLPVACTSSESDPSGLGLESEEEKASAAPESREATVLYYEDVAPIMAQRCYRCHFDGGIAPFELKEFEDVEPLGELIQYATEHRIMPPFLADGSGDCQTFKNSQWMSEEEIQTIADWVDQGKAKGDSAAGPEFKLDTQEISRRTHRLQLPESYVPDASAKDDYRCFVLDPGVDKRMFLTEYEVIPGNPEIVHHVIVYAPDDDEAAEEAYAMEAAEGGPGYTCFGSAIVDSQLIAAWAPGTRVTRYPDKTGVPIEAGRPLILQVHYNIDEGVAPDQTTVNLNLQDEVEKELFAWFFADPTIELEPGRKKVSTYLNIQTRFLVGAQYGLEFIKPMELYAVGPHMHKLGQSMRFELIKANDPDEESKNICALDVHRWDFNWQFGYEFDKPIRIEPQDTLSLSCTYDTSQESETVSWGDGTNDEMCLIAMFTTFDDGKIPRPDEHSPEAD